MGPQKIASEESFRLPETGRSNGRPGRGTRRIGNIYTYIHTYVHTLVHAVIRSYMGWVQGWEEGHGVFVRQILTNMSTHACMNACMHYHACIHTYTSAQMHTCIYLPNVHMDMHAKTTPPLFLALAIPRSHSPPLPPSLPLSRQWRLSRSSSLRWLIPSDLVSSLGPSQELKDPGA
jgi:hypothetical protein